MLTLTLAAGLLAACAPQAEPPKGKGWVVEIRGYTYHRQAKDKLIVEFQWPQMKPQPEQAEPQEGWVVEIRGFHKHTTQAEAKLQIEPVETQYLDDLSAFFKQLKKR
jgi:hypothetical protein